MFTAEELENCDLLPKEYTLPCIIKAVFYSIISFISAMLMYSFYSGKDFVSVITFNVASYDESYIINRVALYEPDDLYTNYSKYVINYTETISDTFIKEFIMQNFPALIRNGTNGFNIYEMLNEINETLFNDNNVQLFVETRSNPNIEFYKKGFTYENMNYKEYKAKIITNKNGNYFINDFHVDSIKQNYSNELITNYLQKTPILSKDLLNNGIYYSEGNNGIYIGAHYENTDNFICMLEGNVDFMLVPAMERKYVYPFQSGKGPMNYSPINFFKGEFDKYPLFKEANRIHITLSKGDCMYVPAFWWRNCKSPKEKEFKYISMKYEGISRIVKAIFNGIENKELN